MKKRRWKKMTALSLLFIFFSSNHIPAEPLPQDNPDETQEENEIEIIGINYDITELKETEAKLIMANAPFVQLRFRSGNRACWRTLSPQYARWRCA